MRYILFILSMHSLSFCAECVDFDNIPLPFETCEKEATIEVHKGWNLLSLPIDTNLSKNEIGAKFNNFQTLWKYNTQWHLLGLEVDGIKQLETISTHEGFWINSNEDYNVTLKGVVLTMMNNVPLDTYQDGWYLLGTGLTIEAETLKDTYPNINTVWTYTNNQWQMYPSIEWIKINPLEAIKPSSGFWVHIQNE